VTLGEPRMTHASQDGRCPFPANAPKALARLGVVATGFVVARGARDWHMGWQEPACKGG